MQSDNETIRNVADIARRIISGESPEAIAEALKGNQHKIDKNKNNKIDAEDFKMLRKEEQEVCEKCGCNPCECSVEEESEQIDEVKMADLPSRKVQGKSYGASKPKANPFDVLKGPKSKDLDAIKKDEKKMVPDWARGPNESVSTFSAMLESYKQDGLKSLAKMNKLKEEPDNEQFTKEVEEVKKKASEKKSPEDEARVAKGQVDAVKVEEDIEYFEEASEHGTVFLHKYHEGPSEQEYGSQAKGHTQHAYNVFHKKPGQKPKKIGDTEVNINDETKKHRFAVARTGKSEQDHPNHDKAIAHLMRKAGVHPNAPIKYVKNEKQMNEEVEQIDELTGKGKLPQIAAYHKQKGDEAKDKMETIRNTNRTLPVPKEKSAKIHSKDAESTYHYTQAKRAKSLMAKEDVEQIEEREMTDAEMKKREDIVKGMKKGIQGFKARYGDRAKNVMYATATKQAMKEENDEEV